MAEDVIIRERHGAIVRIWLNRPEVENCLNDAIYDGLIRELDEASRDESVGAVVLTGKGSAFSRSADGEEIGEKYFGSRGDYRGFLVRVRDLHTRIESVPRPVIAAVNGVASMGGIELALACDFIVAAESARLGDAHPGGVGGGGASQTLRAALGSRMARWLLYTGELLPAARALEVGLVQQVLPDAGFQEAVMALADRIVSRRLGDSLSRIKSLTVPRDPTLADRELEIGHSIEHYFDSRTQEGLAGALEADARWNEGEE
jgi:enoyl-CoA hydratase/carnithine racemase